MSREYEELKECGTYFLVTMNKDYPAARPFGSLKEMDGEIYFSTNDKNEAHKQLREDPHIQMVAMKKDGHGWVRLTGLAHEVTDPGIKEKMLEGSRLKARYEEMGKEHFLVFRFTVEKAEFK